MTWTRLSDDFTDRPQITDVESRSARWLHVEALVHCNRHLTDGRLTRKALRRISDSDNLDADVAELERVELWTPWADGKGWDVDWTDQERASDVRRRREAEAERQRRHRQHRAGDHSLCDPKKCPSRRDELRDVTRDTTGDVTHDVQGGVTPVVTAPRPVPAQPGPKEPGWSPGRCPNDAIIAADGSCCGKPHVQAVPSIDDDPDAGSAAETAEEPTPRRRQKRGQR